MEYTLLTRIVKFYKTWPQECPSDKNKNINWSHLKTLMTIKDPQKRNFYLNETQKNLWNKNELSQRVKNDYFETLNSQKDSKELIKKSLNKLHCYAGKVLKVIDGDTLFLEVDLGFFVKINLRVRLRGINCAELNSKIINEQKAAISAKEFVEKKILKCEWIAFQTFKLDLHGRYVADVFYLPGETDKEIIFQKGVFLNQELISEGLAIKC